MSNPPRTPAECFSTILLWLSLAVDAHYRAGRFSGPLFIVILDRIRAIGQRFARLADRITTGKYVPRRPTRRPHTAPKPRRPNPLPQGFAWLIKVVPEAAAFGSQLQFLFADPGMAALLEAAPGPMRRPLRSLCHMLGVAPPPILALPAAPRRKPAASERPPRPPPERPKKPSPVRYVFGLRYPPPFPNPV